MSGKRRAHGSGLPPFRLTPEGVAEVKRALDAVRARRRRKPGTVRIAGQVIRPVELDELSPRVQALVKKARVAFITRNSRCPCGSGKRFKRCCMGKE